MTGRFILRDGQPVLEPDLMTWAQWIETADTVIARTTIADILVSTVFLGLDYLCACPELGEKPVLFETMCFYEGVARDACHQERCGGNVDDAKRMHERVCARVRAGEIWVV